MYHVAQAHHGTQHAALQYKAENKQEQQGGQADHQLRGRTQRFRFFCRVLNGGDDAFVEYLAEVIDLVLRALQLLLIGRTVEQRNGLCVFSSFKA